MSEAEYLQKQAENAKAAMRQTTRELFAEIERTIDPRAWTQAHPLAALAAAAVTGFTLATAVTPSKSARGLRRRQRINNLLRKTHPDRPGSEADPTSDNPEHHNVVMAALSVVGKFLALARPILNGLVAAQLARHPPNGHNGVHPQPSTPDHSASASDHANG